jgi:hypothetical protein
VGAGESRPARERAQQCLELHPVWPTGLRIAHGRQRSFVQDVDVKVKPETTTVGVKRGERGGSGRFGAAALEVGVAEAVHTGVDQRSLVDQAAIGERDVGRRVGTEPDGGDALGGNDDADARSRRRARPGRVP